MPLPARRLMATRYHLPCVTKLTRAKRCSPWHSIQSGFPRSVPLQRRSPAVADRASLINAGLRERSHLTDSERA